MLFLSCKANVRVYPVKDGAPTAYQFLLGGLLERYYTLLCALSSIMGNAQV